MLNALSFDVEEWYHAELVRRSVPAEARVSQVEAAVMPILDLLARRSVRATFFFVGEVARDHPDLVRAIAAAGHEIGCHGMTHRPLWELSPDSLRQELEEFRQNTRQLPTVKGFRAPTFSLDQRTGWALAVLADAGYSYDSSIFPVANYMYGVNGGPVGAYRPAADDLRREDPTGPVVELPMTVWEVAGRRLPVSGGFYLRAIPWSLLIRALRQVTKVRPAVLYLHPWEAYAETPIVPGLSHRESFVTYYNRASALAKLERLLNEFAFGPLCEVLAPYLANGPSVRAEVTP